MSRTQLNAREELVLGTVIDLYIRTGEPVASQAVARQFAEREGLSSATIRNVMAALGEAGLLEQSHTSAGRTPTPAAFRSYVERFTEPGQSKAVRGERQFRVVRFGPDLNSAGGSIGSTSAHLDLRGLSGGNAGGLSQVGSGLSEETRGQIDESLSGVRSTNEYLERTSHVLALLSSGLGVAVGGTPTRQVLEHVHFSRLTAGRVLAVVVMAGGSVQDRVLLLDKDLSVIELETAARYLNENFRGWEVDRIRVEVVRRMEAEREAYAQLLTSVEELCRKGALEESAAPAVFVEGMANLIGSERDRGQLKEMMMALEAKERLVALLTAYVDQREREVCVVVGLDEALPAMEDMVLIAAPARIGSEAEATVALIAPTRIEYREMIQAVRYVAGLSERLIG